MSRPLPFSLLRLAAPATVFAAALLSPLAASAAGYGDVTGTVLLNGDAPTLPNRVEKGDMTVKDAETCADQAIPATALIVGENKGIANVFLYPVRPPRDINPALKALPEDPLVFDQEGCVFEPHCLIVRAGQTLTLKSGDPVAHNVRFTGLRNRPGLNTIVPANDKKGVDVSFKNGEPSRSRCSATSTPG